MRKESPRLFFTPRLFLLKSGNRIHMGQKFTGEYTLECMNDIRTMTILFVVFAGTGTGEGPHNHMILELLRTGYKGQIASINVVRYNNDLAYEPLYRELEKKISHALISRAHHARGGYINNKI